MSSAFWYLGRGTGVVSLVLFTLVVALGIATRSGRPLPGMPRVVVAGVHRSASLLALVFLGVHVGTLMLDPYAQLKLLDVVLPFAGTYRPLWLGLGTVALDLMVALIVTSLLRHRISPAAWRAVHWLAYAAWPVALLHGLGTGSDSGTRWLLAVTGGCVITVLAALAWRVSPSFAHRIPHARNPLLRTSADRVGVPASRRAPGTDHDLRSELFATAASRESHR